MNADSPGGPVERTVRWRCDECEWIGDDSELLRGQNPFDPAAIVAGCPMCKVIGLFTNICDEPGCKREATCGGRGYGGEYRRTCNSHAEWLNKPSNTGNEPRR